MTALFGKPVILQRAPSALGAADARTSRAALRLPWATAARPIPGLKTAALALFVACTLLFFYRLGGRELTRSHEARAAQNAVSIIEDGQWALPRLLDQRVELQKPPLYYWLVALTALLQGRIVDAWAVRLPAAISALGCVLVVVGLLWQRGRPLAGLFAGGILATFIHFPWLARTGRIDMPLTLAVTLALAGFYLGQRRWSLLAYCSIAAGILLKGPIALVLPVIVLVSFRIAQRCGQRGRVGIAHHDRASGGQCPPYKTLWWGIPLVLLLTAPWFVWAEIETDGRFFEVFFWHHNFQRGLGGSNLASHPWWFYLPRLVVDLLPWSLFLPVAAFFAFRTKDDAEARFGGVWLLAIVGFLSLMSFKRADYLLPAYPGAALLLGCFLETKLLAIWNERRFDLRAALVGLILVGAFAGWATYIQWFEAARDVGATQRLFAHEIRSRTEHPVIFFRAEDHALAFHVGRPLDTILEWENLEWWATQSVPICIVMPESCAAEWPRHLKSGKLEEVCRTADLSPENGSRALVLLRSVVR